MTLHAPEKQAENCDRHHPSLRDMLQLDLPVEAKVSPAGSRVAASVRTTNWKDDGYETVCLVYDLATGAMHPVTRSGNVTQVEWVDDAHSFPEVYLAESTGDGGSWRVRRLSDFGRAIQGWEVGTLEMVRWKNKDGVEIEGMLRKPAGFAPGRRYPLVWVLKPNYRGSVGRGQAFAELNVNNLGIGDLWDLESAIHHLVGLGWVDAERVGCMGWSQGGYISAFAELHSDRFRAVSVGAGISDWYTYYISNDIPDFTVDCLSGSPFGNRDLYVKTAPISNLANAKTPTLIQHGSEDRRVPLSNAFELYCGLKERGVPVEFFIYPGMGHPITKPRENHAVMHQNPAWFNHYLLGEALQLE